MFRSGHLYVFGLDRAMSENGSNHFVRSASIARSTLSAYNNEEILDMFSHIVHFLFFTVAEYRGTHGSRQVHIKTRKSEDQHVKVE